MICLCSQRSPPPSDPGRPVNSAPPAIRTRQRLAGSGGARSPSPGRPNPSFLRKLTSRLRGWWSGALEGSPRAPRLPAQSQAGEVKRPGGEGEIVSKRLNFGTRLGKPRFPVQDDAFVVATFAPAFGQQGLRGSLSRPALSAAPPWILVSPFKSGN